MDQAAAQYQMAQQGGMAAMPGMGFQQPLGGPTMGMDVGLGLERVFPCVRLRYVQLLSWH